MFTLPDIFNAYTYKDMMNESEQENFWMKYIDILHWYKRPTICSKGIFPDITWFEDGVLNACYNAVDRHPVDKLAMIYQMECGGVQQYKYADVKREVMRLSNIYIECNNNIINMSCVTIYMPMIPHTLFSALAAARVGYVHNVVFGGYSSESLRLRLIDSNSTILVTTLHYNRGNKNIDFLATVKEAVKGTNVKNIIIIDEIDNKTFIMENKDIEYFCNNGIEIRILSQQKYAEVECKEVKAEHPLFYLYTSGSTGRPKGIMHTTAGYLLYVMLTTRYCFDLLKDDLFCCTADLGWITGHSYTLYGPMLLGVTTVVVGGILTHPRGDRVFEMIDKLNITHFYTAPTLIRMIRQLSTEEEFRTFKMKKLRVIGSVGEPISADAYEWYSKQFNNLPIIDTYWQTEAGGIMISPIPGQSKRKPECASLPFPGMKPRIVKLEEEFESDSTINISTVDNTEKESTTINTSPRECKPYELGYLVFSAPWPSMARTILNDRARYIKSYFKSIPHHYFTGDKGYIDNDKYIWIRGRVDDVLNVSGHRLSTAEIESAATQLDEINEAAVVGIEDKITGQAIVLFISASIQSNNIEERVTQTIRKAIGPIIRIKKIYCVKELPKTTTGKLMRRVLRNILSNKEQGDISTCINPHSINDITNVIYKQ